MSWPTGTAPVGPPPARATNDTRVFAAFKLNFNAAGGVLSSCPARRARRREAPPSVTGGGYRVESLGTQPHAEHLGITARRPPGRWPGPCGPAVPGRVRRQQQWGSYAA
jgi:hypothetical protein